MKYTVSVKPGKSVSSVKEIDPTHLVVSVKEPPIDGRANSGVIIALAKFFRISPNKINIVSGYSSRLKIVEVLS